MSWLTSSRRGARLVAPVTGVLLLAACTGGTPEAAESSTPAVVVTPSPTPTSDADRVAQRGCDREAHAAGRARRAAERGRGGGGGGVLPRSSTRTSYATGDLSDWSDLSHPECVFCASVDDADAEAMAARGQQHDEGGRTASRRLASGVEVEPGGLVHGRRGPHPGPVRDTSTRPGRGQGVFPGTKSTHVDHRCRLAERVVELIREVDSDEEPAAVTGALALVAPDAVAAASSSSASTSARRRGIDGTREDDATTCV